jgi:hypothetical protein
MADESGASELLSTKITKGRVKGEQSTRAGSDDEQRPALPPRPTDSTLQPSAAKRAPLQSQPTTALTSIDIQTISFPDGSRETFSAVSGQPKTAPISGSRKVSRSGSEVDDDASIVSHAPTSRAGGDLDSLLGNEFDVQSPAWKLLNSHTDSVPFETIELGEDDKLSSFEHEFDEIADIDSVGGNEGLFPNHILAAVEINSY